jgi:HEAT repeat protein
MRFRLPAIDQLSFWLGFILSGVLWWFLSLFRPAVKQLMENSKAQRQEKKKATQSVSAVEERYRKSILQYAQGLHLAAPLFSLDEIIQPPRLLAPPIQLEPGSPIPNEDIVESAVPYLPTWPDLAGIYKAPTLTLTEALSKDIDLIITGLPGTGKTIALAYIASCIARRDPEFGTLKEYVPFFVHAANLDMPVDAENGLQAIIKLASERAAAHDLGRIPEFVRNAFSAGRAILLLDGMDELTADGIRGIGEFIGQIEHTYPTTRLVATGSMDNLDGLLSLNLFPLAIAPWDAALRVNFTNKWADLWTKYVPVETWTKQEENIDPILLNSWLLSDSPNLTPLELTLKTWGAYAGDLRGSRPVDDLECHLSRMLPSNVSPEALEQLAVQVTIAGLSSFDPRKAREWVRVFESPEADPPEEIEVQEDQKTKKNRQEKLAPPSQGLISRLINSGLLAEYSNNQVRFSHQVFGGYLAGKGLINFKPDPLLDEPVWIGKRIAMHYLAILGDASSLVEKLTAQEERPLWRNLFMVSRWLRDIPNHLPWRNQVLSKLVAILQQEGQPLGLRGQAVSALIQVQKDASITTLFRNLLAGGSPDTQQLAALASGALQDTKSLDPLIQLISNPNTNVRSAACLALVAIGTETAINAVAEILLRGDENQRRTAAEALANAPELGYIMLKEGANLKDDLMVRRASVYGLGRIRDQWADELLTRLQTEDDQWVVRNAAGEVLDSRQQPNAHIPKPLPPPTESPWMIAYAGKQGMGVTPDKPPTDLLLSALKSSVPEERLAALNYLRLYPTEGVIGALYNAMYSGDRELREAVFYVLSEIAAHGIQLPNPAQYGLGA